MLASAPPAPAVSSRRAAAAERAAAAARAAAADRVSEELGDLLRGQPLWQRLRLVGRDGGVLLQVDRGVPQPGGAVAPAIADDDQEALRIVLDAAPGQLFVSPLHDDAANRVSLAAAVRDASGQTVAALLVELPESALIGRLPVPQPLRAARWHLLDRSGRVLRWQGRPGAAETPRLLPAIQVGDSLPRTVADRVMRGDSGQLEDGNRSVLFAGVDAKLALISNAASPLRWSLAVSAPTTELRGAAAAPTLWYLALAVLLVGMTAAGLVFARRLLRPWHRLQQHAAEIADGHFEQRIEIPRGGALAPIAGSINRLAERLQEARENKEALERRASQQQALAARRGQELAAALEEAIADLPHGVILADHRGQVAHATARAAELLGIAAERLDDSWLPALLPPIEATLDAAEAAQLRIRRPRGVLLVAVRPLATRADGPLRFAITLTEVDDSADSHPPVVIPPALVGELAGATTEALARPLGGLIKMAQALLRNDALPPEPRKHLSRLADELGKLADRLAPLADRSMPIEPARQAIDAADTIDRSLAAWATSATRRHLTFDVSGLLRDDTRIDADPDLFERLLHHLIANAMDAIPEGGRLAVSSEGRAQHLEIVLEDDGEGIEGSALPKLFDAFQGSRDDHAGLGLASARRILAAHGAEVAVASAPGKGTRIRMSWPLAGAA